MAELLSRPVDHSTLVAESFTFFAERGEISLRIEEAVVSGNLNGKLVCGERRKTFHPHLVLDTVNDPGGPFTV